IASKEEETAVSAAALRGAEPGGVGAHGFGLVASRGGFGVTSGRHDGATRVQRWKPGTCRARAGARAMGVVVGKRTWPPKPSRRCGVAPLLHPLLVGSISACSRLSRQVRCPRGSALPGAGTCPASGRGKHEPFHTAPLPPTRVRRLRT